MAFIRLNKFRFLNLFFIFGLSLSFLADSPAKAMSCDRAFTSGKNGMVRFLETPSGVKVAEKHYFEIAQAREDQFLFEIASHYLSQVSDPDAFKVLVPDWEPGTRITTRPFVAGRTIHEILLDESISISGRDKLRQRFINASSKLGQIITANYFHVQITTTDFNTKFFQSPESDDSPIYRIRFSLAPQNWIVRFLGINSYEFILKTDNIVVEDSTNDLYLIDPY